MTVSPPRVDALGTKGVIHAISRTGTPASNTTAPASAAYPLANLALYVPFTVSHPVTAEAGWVVTGATAGGNFDIGVYSAAGVRLDSSGATSRVVSSINNTAAIGLVLVPGVRYYMAFSADATSNYLSTTASAGLYQADGVLESTTSYVLPTNPTLSLTTRAYLPMFGLNLETVAL